jgi:hypothetical protein
VPVGDFFASHAAWSWAAVTNKWPPLGYELKDGKLVVEEEAERVRLIFRRYLEVSGINELVGDLRAKKHLYQGEDARYDG